MTDIPNPIPSREDFSRRDCVGVIFWSEVGWSSPENVSPPQVVGCTTDKDELDIQLFVRNRYYHFYDVYAWS